MNPRSFLFAFALITCAADAQVNITQLGHLDYQALRSSDLSNIWGYTDELGNEYALVGVNGNDNANPPQPGGLSVVDVSDPANPVEVFFAPSEVSIWREIKTWGDYAYVTTEAQAGLLIVDLSPLPGGTPTVTTFIGNNWITSHSLFIDENGRLYLNGSDRGNGGIIMYDLSQDPLDPVEVGTYDTYYVHDCYARGDTLYAAHIYDGFFSIVDVSDPSNPVVLGTQSTPSTFTHNVWLDDTGDHLFTTDERSDAYVGSYDVSDPTDIQFEDKLQSDPGSLTIPHNTYWLDHFLVTSYYTYGVVIYDATHPADLVETGHFDSSPFSGDGFNGDWGVYPFFPSGNLVVSDIEGGLYILAPTYVHACWLEGNVTDANTTGPVNGATISILTTTVSDATGLDGHYATGYGTAGTYDVLVSAPGYEDFTATAVVLANGQVTLLDVALVPLVPFNFSGQVTDAGTTQGVPGATVLLDGEDYDYTVTCDANGMFTVSNMFAGTYAVVAGAWGWHTNCSLTLVIDANTPTLTIALVPGYYDDFTLDFGWTHGGNASTGFWQREAPVLTMLGGLQSNPGADLTDDCGEKAYVTGNAGGAAGDDDVDGGTVWLNSPVFDCSTMPDAHVRWNRWFFNGGGGGSPNDTLKFQLSNGIDTVTIANVAANSAPGMSQWVERMLRISDRIAPTATMHFMVRATDNAPGHIVEGGLDRFEVLADPFATVGEHGSVAALSIWPNPNDGSFMISDGDPSTSTVTISDMEGRTIDTFAMNSGTLRVDRALLSGIYLVRVLHADGSTAVRRMVVR